MKRKTKILATLSTMIMSMTLMVFGVYAALSQTIDINGKVVTDIGSNDSNVKMAVYASIKGGEIQNYQSYGHKPAHVLSISFNAPDIELDDSNYFISHMFDFENYGIAIDELTIEVTSSSNSFNDCFDYYIGYDEQQLSSSNITWRVTSFLPNGIDRVNDQPPYKRVFVRIQLKDDPIIDDEATSIIAFYKIKIDYKGA